MKPWKIVSETLKYLVSEVKPGVTTKYLDGLAAKKIKQLGGKSYNKGYHPKFAPTPFPATVCTSVNDVIAHGIPSDYILQDGDIINFDLGVEKDGLCGDGALTVHVGNISNRDERLLRYAKRTLYEGIKQVAPGVKIKEIGKAMEIYAKIMGFTINFHFCGHHIGKQMHEDPVIPSVYLPGLGEEELKVGDMVCIEPMLTYKDNVGVVQPDGWSWKTKDGRKSAMFEHQILIKEGGYEILTDHISDDR